MKVLSKSPYMDFEEMEINNSLERLQKAVGGYIETVTFNTDAGQFVVICNEEGRLKGLSHNCVVEGVDFVGNIIIAGITEDDFTDVPAEVIKYLKKAI